MFFFQCSVSGICERFIGILFFVFVSVSLIEKILNVTSNSVVECLTRDRGAAGLSLIGVTALCP